MLNMTFVFLVSSINQPGVIIRSTFPELIGLHREIDYIHTLWTLFGIYLIWPLTYLIKFNKILHTNR